MDVFLFIDDLEPNSLAVIPGMGIPEQLKLAMEQEQMGKRSCTYKFYFYKTFVDLFLIFMVLNYFENAKMIYVEKC